MMRLFAVVSVALFAICLPGAADSASWPRPEISDAALHIDCVEYQKAASGHRAITALAVTCRDFMAGYMYGWLNAQNTPSGILPKSCAKSVDGFVRAYLAGDDGRGPMPPEAALMGTLTMKMGCR